MIKFLFTSVVWGGASCKELLTIDIRFAKTKAKEKSFLFF
jgi:hypothetical protein